MFSLRQEINMAYNAGSKVIDSIINKTDEELIDIVKQNNLSEVDYIINNNPKITRGDGEIYFRTNNGFPYFLIDSVACYHILDYNNQPQIKFTASLKV